MDALREWHEFYTVIGTAAATLIGAMFVVVSIGSGLINQERSLELRIYTTPTVMHLAVVLFGCALIFVPTLSRTGFGILFGIGALGGLAYAGRNCFHIIPRQTDRSDQLWYGAMPVLGYVGAVGAMALLLLHRAGALELLAVAFALLLASGIRNAWDLIIFFVARAGEPD